jgi:hypothetical protein
MTRQIQHHIKCRKCNQVYQCPSCQEEATASTPFSDWMRALPPPFTSANYDNENLDFIWFHYRQGWLITIEEKRYGARSTVAQLDTHHIIEQMLTNGSAAPVGTMRGVRPIEYRGHYQVVFENTTPADSTWIMVNDRLYDKVGLMALLSTGKLPENSWE